MPGGVPTGTVTFLFTDIEGSTRLWDEHAAAMADQLARHDEILQGVIEAHDGHVFSLGGDGFAAAFQRASDAVAAAVDAQRRLRPLADGDVPIGVRMGIHTGEAHERNGNYYGPTLNRAARLMSAANGGQILMSSATRGLLDASDPSGAVDLGMHRLRGIAEPVQAFGVTAPDWPWVDRPLLVASRNRLPAPPSEIVGRAADLARLGRELRSHRVVTLVGPGGVGKTRLALEAAILTSELYADGAHLVELAPVVDPDAVLGAVAGTLGVHQQTTVPLEAELLATLHRSRALLVIDNCEHVLGGVAPLVARIVAAAPDVRVLATSREPLAIGGEVVWPVASLDTEVDAVELFCRRAHEADASFSPTDADREVITRICERLDGIPLAIELAAVRIRSLTVQEILDRLADRFKLLRGASRGGIERHQSLHATVSWSYQLLDDDERAVFDQCSVFGGKFDLRAAEAVCETDADVLDVLTSLVDKAMVVADRSGTRTRYGMLETLRQFGEQRLTDMGTAAAVRDRHLAHYRSVVAHAYELLRTSGFVECNQLLQTELDNIRVAVSWALAREDVATVCEIVQQMVNWTSAVVSPDTALWATEGLRVAERHGLAAPALLRALAAHANRLGDYMGGAAWALEAIVAGERTESAAEALSPALELCVSYGMTSHPGKGRAMAMAEQLVPELEPFDVAVVDIILALVTDPNVEPEHRTYVQRLRSYVQATGNSYADGWYRWIEILDLMYEGNALAALERLPGEIARADASGNLFLRGAVLGSQALVLASLDDESLNTEFVRVLRETRERHSHAPLLWALEAISDRWARTGPHDAAARLLGFLRANHVESIRALRDRDREQRLGDALPDFDELSGEGARWSLDDAVDHVLAVLEPNG